MNVECCTHLLLKAILHKTQDHFLVIDVVQFKIGGQVNTLDTVVDILHGKG